MNSQLLWWSKSQRCAIFSALALVLAVLSGCTPGPMVQVKSGNGDISVVRLKDGREGFIIKEKPSMDSESRRDFKHAVAMMEDGNYDQAIDLLEKVIERTPGVTAPYVNIAMAYVHLDKMKPAEKHLKTALSMVPGHPAVSNEYGLLLRKSGRFTEAREIYEKALEIFPEYLPAHRNLGILCDLYLNDQKCAVTHYEIYSKAKPEDAQVKIWIADLNMQLAR